jgi:hypothetical protein
LQHRRWEGTGARGPRPLGAGVGPGTSGWLGSTAGVTSDGKFVATARFESPDAAQRNSDRPEQDQWWAKTSKLISGEPTFQDSTDVVVDVIGDPDSAGFVQVMQGRGTDPDRARELMGEDSRSGPRSSAVWQPNTTAGRTRWCCTSPPRRQRAKVRAKSRHRS